MRPILILLLGVILLGGCKKEGRPVITPYGVSITDGSVIEGNGGNVVIEFEVKTDATVFGTDKVTVWLTTVEGSAKSGTDFVARNNVEVSFAAGEQSKKFQVEIVEDTVQEPNETFSVVVNSVSANAKIVDGTATGTIQNDD